MQNCHACLLNVRFLILLEMRNQGCLSNERKKLTWRFIRKRRTELKFIACIFDHFNLLKRMINQNSANNHAGSAG